MWLRSASASLSTYSAVGQVRVEKDESHPGKVMFRNVYERNKDKFPYSRFEVLVRHSKCGPARLYTAYSPPHSFARVSVLFFPPPGL